MDPLYNFQENGAWGADLSAAFAANSQQQSSQDGSTNAPWFQTTGGLEATPKVNGKPMFDLSNFGLGGGQDNTNNSSSAAAQSNSLNQLLSQHLDAQQQQQGQQQRAAVAAAAQVQQHHQTQNFGHPQSHLAALFADDHFAPTPIRAAPPQAAPTLPTLPQVAGNNAAANAANSNGGGGQNGGAPSMFVATLVDPTQENATPQQMLFLPGTNQVIPMSGANEGQLLSLNDMPVVFQPQAGTGASTQPMFNATPQELAPMQLPTLHPRGPLGATVATAPPPPTKPEKKEPAANMPIRPLSAYNFFFSDERERILNDDDSGGSDDVYDDAKKQRLLLAHLAKDRTKRRPHRKTHGKINFTTLSKLIGQRWRALSEERKNFYRQVASIDLERYQRELRERGGNNGGNSSSAASSVKQEPQAI